MSSINAPKGTQDLLPAVTPQWQAVERIARETAELYHFAEIRTPIFEHSELFHRGVGETTDIVHKETYTFDDRGGRSLTLRPEGTAGVVRAVIENGLVNDAGARLKLFYIGAYFRYERPAAGRYRVHNQFGAEAFGIAEPEQDVECIELQMDFYRRAGLKDLAFRINSLGDKESKERYRAALVAFLSPKSEQLSEDSKRRLTENPLRILDSKDPRDVEAVKGAPPATESLSDKSKSHFEKVASLLQQAGVAFSIDGSLVRGFDYYTDTLWEVTAGGLGSQNAVGGGGRYDNLVEALGGRATPGVGFGCGLERLLIALESQGVPIETKSKPLVWLVSIGDAARDANLKLLQQLRASNIAADMDPTGRSPKAQFKLADREKAAICLITGDSELANNVIEMKDMKAHSNKSASRAIQL